MGDDGDGISCSLLIQAVAEKFHANLLPLGRSAGPSSARNQNKVDENPCSNFNLQRHLVLQRIPSSGSMASTSRALMRLPASSIAFNIATRRTFATSSGPFLARGRTSSKIPFDKSKLQQTFRRTYADLAPVRKPRRFRYFRYLWRITYLTAIAGTAYLAFGVYDLRHPEDQFEPDPAKKNLVILGR